MNTTVIILAGGRSSRMGSDKGLVLLHQIPMLQWVINALPKTANMDVIIIAHHEDYNQFNVPVFSDIYPDKGPLGGIYTGLFHSKSMKNIVLSCDIPFIEKELIEALIALPMKELITIVEHEGVTHNLIGVYSKALVPDLKNCLLKDDFKVRHFLSDQNAQTLSLTELVPGASTKMVANINTLNDLNILNYGH